MGLSAFAAAQAQNFPAKPIRLVIPASAGTPVDILSRVVATKMSSELGQSVVVDNNLACGCPCWCAGRAALGQGWCMTRPT